MTLSKRRRLQHVGRDTERGAVPLRQLLKQGGYFPTVCLLVGSSVSRIQLVNMDFTFLKEACLVTTNY